MQETQETWVQSLRWEDPLEKQTASPSSVLAWKIPWTQEPWGCTESDTTEATKLTQRHVWRNLFLSVDQLGVWGLQKATSEPSLHPLIFMRLWFSTCRTTASNVKYSRRYSWSWRPLRLGAELFSVGEECRNLLTEYYGVLLASGHIKLLLKDPGGGGEDLEISLGNKQDRTLCPQEVTGLRLALSDLRGCGRKQGFALDWMQ